MTSLPNAATSGSAPMFLAEYAPVGAGEMVDPTVLPEGMLAVHTITNGWNGSRTLLTYWASEADFRRDGGGFGAHFLGSTMSPRGYVGSPIRHPQPWYKKLTPVTWILTLTTVLGALDALYNRYELLFAAPSVFVKPDTGDTNTRHAVENLPVSVKFSVRNPLDVALRELRVAAVMKSPGGAAAEDGCRGCVPMILDEEDISKLSAGESTTLVAQVLDSADLTAGRWEAVVTAHARAGYLRGEQAFRRRIPVEIWQPLAVERLSSEARGQIAGVLNGRIKVGVALPQGMECIAVVNGLSGLFSGRVALKDVSGNELVKSTSWAPREPTATLYRMKWQSVPVDKGFTTLYYQVFIEGAESTNWGKLKDSTKVDCYPRKPGE